MGYLAVKDNINNVSYGAMFALVAGMMVFISLAELLPSAYRHDVNHAIVTSSWVSPRISPCDALLWHCRFLEC